VEKRVIRKGALVFGKKNSAEEKTIQEERDFLYKKVGEQTIRIDWLKKS